MPPKLAGPILRRSRQGVARLRNMAASLAGTTALRKRVPHTTHAPEATEVPPRAGEVYRDVVIRRKDVDFQNFVSVADDFWAANIAPGEGPVILVDLMVQDLAVAVRSLTIANGIRRCQPATLVGVMGAEPEWEHAVWDYHDDDDMKALATAYGVREFIHVGSWAERLRRGGNPTMTVAGHTLTAVETRLPSSYVSFEAVSSALRILRFPRDSEAMRRLPETEGIIDRTQQFARIWQALMSGLEPLALIVSHVDYSTWGTAVNTAIAEGIPVIHTQSTGSLKAYAWFPESGGSGSFRQRMTTQIEQFFTEAIWPHRALLRRPAEAVAARVKRDAGRPAWWRDGGSLAIVTREEREHLRLTTGARLGLDVGKPVIVVFAHAQSDALGSNIEVFDDFVDWLEETARFAAEHDEVNWVFLDHPSQFRYDHTDYFSTLASRFGELQHMRFMPSLNLRKNALWSLTDLAVTVRGSASNEFPTFGIPAVQAGWSEWSHLGFTQLAATREEYFSMLSHSIESLLADVPLMTPEQIEKARLWQWFYRSAADVATPLIPPFQMGGGDAMFSAIRMSMHNVEVDADPGLAGVRRMWTRREPMLTRIDFAGDIADQIGIVPDSSDMSVPDFALRTRFDPEHPAMSGSAELSSGASPSLSQVDGIIAGRAVVGRINASRGLMVLAYDPPGDTSLRVDIALQTDEHTRPWWVTYAPGPEKRKSPPTRRHLVVYCQHEPMAYADIPPAADDHPSVHHVSFSVPRGLTRDARLLTIELVGLVPHGTRDGTSTATLLSGVQINTVTITPATDDTVHESPVVFDAEHNALIVHRVNQPDLVGTPG